VNEELWRTSGAGDDAELDAWLSQTWEAAATAIATMLDLPAGKEALLAGAPLAADGIAELRPPAGLTRTVARRGRRLALVSTAGAATLAAGVAALVVAGASREPHHGSEAPVVSTAYVVGRVDGALTAADPTAIAQMTVTTRGPAGTTTAEEWSYGDQSRSVTNSPNGRPAYDTGLSSGLVYTVVSYATRAWARHHRPTAPVSGPSGCGSGAAVVPLLFEPGQTSVRFAASWLPATVVRDLRSAISCRTLAVAGWQRVDGVDAIRLTSRSSTGPGETIWVSPGTYLPVRVLAAQDLGGSVFLETADIAWLKPTAPNLARLTVPIPAGFREVPVARILSAARRRTWG
jgi:hypothetical protein